MGVLIKGMKMPKNCDECRFHVDGWCYVLRPESEEERKRITTNYCPLIEVPPHGRLIDADALMEYKTLFVELNQQIMSIRTWAVNVCDILNAPTIIPAEEATDDN